jgi:DNA/RNA endonuclease G (NUC1)
VSNSNWASGYSFIFSNAKPQINRTNKVSSLEMERIKPYLKLKKD